MTPKERDDFKEAYEKEKDPDVKIRMAAVNMIHVENQDAKVVARGLLKSRDWAYFWVRRFREGGIEALRDRPRDGRPPKVRPKLVAKIIEDVHDGVITPQTLGVDIRDRVTG